MKAHLRKAGGTRSACRYSSRPSRQVKLLSIQEFADTPVEFRCSECEEKYQRLCASLQRKPGPDQAKEAFFRVYDQNGQAAALSAYAAWERSLAPEIREAFKPIITAIRNWQPHIFTYFDHPVTNAYTESLNSLIRVMNRLGRGYSFEALRAKILFTEGAQKVKKPKFERRAESDLAEGFVGFALALTMPSTRTEERAINYGADISTLARLIEAGEL